MMPKVLASRIVIAFFSTTVNASSAQLNWTKINWGTKTKISFPIVFPRFLSNQTEKTNMNINYTRFEEIVYDGRETHSCKVRRDCNWSRWSLERRLELRGEAHLHPPWRLFNISVNLHLRFSLSVSTGDTGV